MVFAAIA
jgi:predicted RND superfamily exporter protein